MDNFFDVLIVLFFIGSLLAPLFKKKKEEQKPTYENPNMPRRREPEPVSGKSTDDLLGELEELFGKKRETRAQTDYEHTPIIIKPESTARESTQRDSEVDYDLDKTYDSAPSLEVERKESEIEKINRETREILASTARKKKEASKLRSDSQFRQKEKAEPLYGNERSSTYSKKRLLSNLKNPGTLKDYMVISELIGKPKALKNRR